MSPEDAFILNYFIYSVCSISLIFFLIFIVYLIYIAYVCRFCRISTCRHFACCRSRYWKEMEGRSQLVTKLTSQPFAYFGPQLGHLQCSQNCNADKPDACPLKKTYLTKTPNSFTYLHVIVHLFWEKRAVCQTFKVDRQVMLLQCR